MPVYAREEAHLQANLRTACLERLRPWMAPSYLTQTNNQEDNNLNALPARVQLKCHSTSWKESIRL